MDAALSLNIKDDSSYIFFDDAMINERQSDWPRNPYKRRSDNDELSDSFVSYGGSGSSGDDYYYQVFKITPTLYFGSTGDRLNKLKQRQITHILSLSEQQLVIPCCKVLRVPMDNNGRSDLKEIMIRTFGFMFDGQQEGCKLIVHCRGQNRSAVIVIAWLIKTWNTSLHDAYSFVKKKRSSIQPHWTYMLQLRDFDKLLHGSHAAPSLSPAYRNDSRTTKQSCAYETSQKMGKVGMEISPFAPESLISLGVIPDKNELSNEKPEEGKQSQNKTINDHKNNIFFASLFNRSDNIIEHSRSYS